MHAAGVERSGLGALALAAAAGALAAGTHPTALVGSDAVLVAAFAIAVTVVASLATPWAWLVASAVAAIAGTGGLTALGLVAAGVALAATRQPARLDRPLVGGAIGAVLVQVLLRMPSGEQGLDLLGCMLVVGILGWSAWTRVGAGTRARARASRLLVVLGLAAAAAVVGFVFALALARADVATGVDRSEKGLAAARHGEGERAASLFDEAADAFRAAEGDLDSWWAKPALALPVIGQHARSLEIVSGAGAQLADAASTSAREVRLDDLEVRDGRVDLDLIREMREPLASVRAALADAAGTAASAESAWLVPPVADRVDRFRDAIDRASDEAATAAQAVAVVPELLGGSEPRAYFVAFGNPAETRELGGFMGAYAGVVAEDGELRLVASGRVLNLNSALRGRSFSDRDAFPADFLALRPQFYWQNMTGTADFPTVAEAMDQLWPEQTLGTMDGFLYLDPKTLAALLELTGPIRVEGRAEPLTAENAASFLLREQYVQFPDDDRHDFLTEATGEVFEALTSGDLPAPRVVAEALAPSVRQRRLLVQSRHPREQALLRRLGVDGGLPPVDGDFVSVRASNRGLNKVDAYMQRTIDYDVTVDPDRGAVRATLAVTVRNDVPSSGLAESAAANRLGRPLGTNSTTVTVYTPLDLVDVRQGGRAIGRSAGREYGRAVYSANLDVAPGEEVTVVFELAGAVDLRDGYHLDVVPQPLVNADRLHVTVRGAGSWAALGDADREIELDHLERVDLPLHDFG